MPSENLGIDLGSTGGSWLFKQGELLLGPVPLTRLVELLYLGEVDETTLVAPFNLDPQFTPLGKVERFRVHLAKAKAKLRVEAQSHAEDRVRRRKRMLRLTSMGVLSIALLLGGGRLAWWLALHRPWEKVIQLPEPVITEDELPSVRLASRALEDELAYPDAKTPEVKPRPGERRFRPGAPAPGPGISSPPARRADADGLEVAQQWDQRAINATVNASKWMLHGCLAAEAKRQKVGWEFRVPLEFTIGNDGRVTRLWIDNPDYKSQDSELFRCLFGELKKWKFPAYQGEQASVSLGFQVRAR